MSNNINLITPRKEESSSDKKKAKIIKNIGFIFLGVIVLFSIVIFIVNLLFSTSSLKRQQQEAIAQIASLNEVSSKLFVLNNRIASISKIIKTRKDMSLLESLSRIIPDTVKIRTFTFDKDKTSFTLNSPSLLPLDNYINQLINKAIKKDMIQSLTINSLTINKKTKEYYLSLTINLL
jgi:Tfp pilus assembly protein PilN